METSVYILLTSAITTVCVTGNDFQVLKASKNVLYENILGTQNQLWMASVDSILMCVFACTETSLCRSVSYNTIDKRCQAYDTNNVTVGVTENGWQHFDIDIIPDPCANIVCQNGGTCSEAVCTCPYGYGGVFCEIDTNPCDPNPCINGRCQSIGQSWSCSCYRGWGGTTCSTPLG